MAQLFAFWSCAHLSLFSGLERKNLKCAEVVKFQTKRINIEKFSKSRWFAFGDRRNYEIIKLPLTPTDCFETEEESTVSKWEKRLKTVSSMWFKVYFVVFTETWIIGISHIERMYGISHSGEDFLKFLGVIFTYLSA